MARPSAVEKIGEGGMGVVYRAHDDQLDRDVALKVLPHAALEDDRSRARLLREARAAAALNHPHICTIHEVGEAAGQAYIAMEFIDGQPLARLIPAGGVPVEGVLRYGLQIADAVAHAHGRGVVHRDLKSGNVVITPERRAKVLDFGLAKRVSGDELAEATTQSLASVSQPGALVGTLPYMAPEQLRGQPADARSDVWALGVVLYELAAGARPFTGDTGFEVSSAILSQPLPPLPAQVPVELRAVIERCLAKAPAERYQQGSEVQVALEAIQTGAVLASWAAWKYVLSRRRLLAGAGVAGALTVMLGTLVGLNVGGLRDQLLGGPAAARIESIAVLPLENLTGDPDQEFLVDGIHDALITDLAKLSGLERVIARSSVGRYRDADIPLPDIAQELGVDAVITGSVMRAGNRVQITGQLIDAVTEELLWAERYERDLEDVLLLQNEIVMAIAQEIELQLTPDERGRLATGPLVNPEAYDAYQRGRASWERLTPASLDTAMEYYQLALEHDPEYALAHVGVGEVWGARIQMGVIPAAEGYPLSQAALDAAFELDDSVPEAWAQLAANRNWLDWDWDGAEEAFRRAIDLDPSASRVRGFYSQYLTMMRRFDEAIAQMEEAMRLSPFDPLLPSLHAVDLVFMKRYEEGVELARSVLDEVPNHGVASTALAEGLYHLGRFDEELDAQRMRAVSSGDREIEEALERGYEAEGYRGAMRLVADVLAARSEQRYVPPQRIMNYYIRAGDLEKALDWAERAFEQRNPNVPVWGVVPIVDVLRGEPRFDTMIREFRYPFED